MQSQQQWMVMGIICASLVHIFMAVESFPIADRITSLPGQPQVSFQQFSGYVTVDEKQQRSLFYYFVEAETQPASKPLALWLNGGPGCSSIGAGAFVEHGPFRPNGDSGNLVKNEYSWNREANMLYLESPAGVGFSYSANASFYTHVNDTITAQDNLIFLQNWFAKFPEYQDNDFFITGESYAGHYVPQLAQLIIQSGLKFNLKGINSWNPLLELGIDFNSGDQYYWSHGVISDATYALLNRVCNSSEMFREAIRGTISPACAFVNIQVSKELTDFIDKYNVNGDVCISNGQPQMGFLYQPFRSRFQTLSSPHSESNPPTQQQSNENEDVCAIENTIKYLNRKDVQKALHAQVVGFDVHWSICRSNDVLRYNLKNFEIPTIVVVGSLVKSGIRALVYSGDQDSVIPFLGTRTLIRACLVDCNRRCNCTKRTLNGLAKELGLNTTESYRARFEGKQVGGWTQVYGKAQLYILCIHKRSFPHSSSHTTREIISAI